MATAEGEHTQRAELPAPASVIPDGNAPGVDIATWGGVTGPIRAIPRAEHPAVWVGEKCWSTTSARTQGLALLAAANFAEAGPRTSGGSPAMSDQTPLQGIDIAPGLSMSRLRYLADALADFHEVENFLGSIDWDKDPSAEILNPGMADAVNGARKLRRELEDNVVAIARRLVELDDGTAEAIPSGMTEEWGVEHDTAPAFGGQRLVAQAGTREEAEEILGHHLMSGMNPVLAHRFATPWEVSTRE